MQENTAQTRRFSLKLNHEIASDGAEVRLWLPLVLKTPYQYPISMYELSSNATKQFVCGELIPTYYAEFSSLEKSAYFRLNFEVQIRERNTDFSKVNFNENERLRPDVEEFLKPSAQSGIVKQKSDEIAGGIKGDLEKARAIYEWVAKNMSRDNGVVACGIGDAEAILSSGKLSGKCADINSVFVELCRASGIAARAMFGIRTGAAKKFSPEMGVMGGGNALEISGAQHCRAEFYLKGYGWIPVDPADVAKVRLGEGLSEDDSKLARVREYLFGNWEPCWVGFNYARGVILNPRPAHIPLDKFSHPYCEVAGEIKDPYLPSSFGYEYLSREI